MRTANVLVVGTGGLAASVLQYLGGAGVGRIRLIDPDRRAAFNLHRQTLFCIADIGTAKAGAAAAQIAAFICESCVDRVVAALDPANASTLCEGADVVLDCADAFAVSHVLLTSVATPACRWSVPL
ncbi:HesA/MoeB/ThiF family protein [Paracoccus sp. (in: a-proteobacteria)]|uniref:HesA/MoeB/ThiF family protein n=1 Tax=Paracoccus sp. TaxID=267 RepID=UPI00396CAEF7